MGRKGWRGSPPNDDDEARKRIVDAAVSLIERSGGRPVSLSEVSELLGITRPTIYRYFASGDQLLAAVSTVTMSGWTARVAQHCIGITDAAELLVEAVAYQVERLPDDPMLQFLMRTDRTDIVRHHWVDPVAIERSRVMLLRTQIDWPAIGFDETNLSDLIEFIHRLVQSLIFVPTSPPRTGEQLRDFLHRHITPVVHSRAAAPPQPVEPDSSDDPA